HYPYVAAATSNCYDLLIRCNMLCLNCFVVLATAWHARVSLALFEAGGRNLPQQRRFSTDASSQGDKLPHGLTKDLRMQVHIFRRRRRGHQRHIVERGQQHTAVQSIQMEETL